MKGEERDQGTKERLKKKFRQNRIKQSTNMDCKRKRKRDQTVHRVDKKDDKSDNDNRRHETGKARRIEPNEKTDQRNTDQRGTDQRDTDQRDTETTGRKETKEKTVEERKGIG